MHSKATGLSLVRLRKQVVFGRFLTRLQVAAPDRWILKGGFALDLRLGGHARPTKDVDLGRHDDENAATADMIATQSLYVGDYFQFHSSARRRWTSSSRDRQSGTMSVRRWQADGSSASWWTWDLVVLSGPPRS